jgi:hypothetical protein
VVGSCSAKRLVRRFRLILSVRTWNPLIPNAGPSFSHDNEVRNVSPHFCGNEPQQQINLPIAGGKFLLAHGSFPEFIEIMVSEWGGLAETRAF